MTPRDLLDNAEYRLRLAKSRYWSEKHIAAKPDPDRVLYARRAVEAATNNVNAIRRAI